MSFRIYLTKDSPQSGPYNPSFDRSNAINVRRHLYSPSQLPQGLTEGQLVMLLQKGSQYQTGPQQSTPLFQQQQQQQQQQGAQVNANFFCICIFASICLFSRPRLPLSPFLIKHRQRPAQS